ncbi:MAG: tRNA (adenosine(37)-N6)-dimethylallyltransferase MiaA [Oscillospiraceae bacterium]|nr:tRNA (adenosine(37)-N6)-dimethylallyltransferase MiaA [Oscillospiraceae bacterium]
MPPQVVCVVGPTASGKTALGVWLAKHYNGEVVSCDSMQIYRRMDIGTAKPTREEMDGVPHHMIDVADPEEDYSAERYRREAVPVVDNILARGKLPIIVGGTGLYLDALLNGHDFAVKSTGWREKLQKKYDEEGIQPLWEALTEIDPESATRLHPMDTKRVIRALEVWYETGETISAHNAATRLLPPRYTALKLGLNYENRADLYARIDARVEEMAASGLADEVRALLESGVSSGCTAMQAIGYKELCAAVEDGGDLTAALDEVKLRSRRYAKRQLTWFRRDRTTQWYRHGSQPDPEALRRFAAEKLAEAGIQ